MEEKQENSNIGCDVQQCRYHCSSSECCTLDHIEVHQECQNATCESNTCCSSFVCC